MVEIDMLKATKKEAARVAVTKTTVDGDMEADRKVEIIDAPTISEVPKKPTDGNIGNQEPIPT